MKQERSIVVSYVIESEAGVVQSRVALIMASSGLVPWKPNGRIQDETTTLHGSER